LRDLDSRATPDPALLQTGVQRPLAGWGGRAPPAPAWFEAATGMEPERRRIEVRGAGIEVLSWGRRGDPGILLAHGARAHADWWSHLAPRLALDRRVTVLSWSGMGRSDWREAYTLDIYAEEAIAAAEASGLFDGLTPPVFLGHSFGGYALIRAARRFGCRLARVITLDAGLNDFHHPPEPGLRRVYGSQAEALARFRLEPAQACLPFVAYWFAIHGLRPATFEEGTGAWTWRFDPDVFSKMGTVSVWDDIPHAACPLVFIHCGASSVGSQETETRLREHAPGDSRFLVLENAEHHPMADDPLGLEDFLSPLL
jgi:pimeloyl-ACP methyl ester carboxylesterase